MFARFLMPVTLGLLSLLLCACGGPKQAITLNLAPGDTRIIKVSSTVNMNSAGTGMDISTTTQSDIKLEMRAKSATADDGIHLEFAILECNLSHSAFGEYTQITLNNSDGQSMKQVLGNTMEGQTFGAIVGADGQMHTITGVREIQQHLQKSINASSFDYVKEVAESIKEKFMEIDIKGFNEEWFSALVAPIFTAPTQRPIGTGKTWTAQPFTKNFTTLNMNLTCTTVLERTLTASMQGEITGGPHEDGSSYTGTASGTAEINTVSGLIKRLVYTSSAKGTGGDIIPTVKIIDSSTYEVLNN